MVMPTLTAQPQLSPARRKMTAIAIRAVLTPGQLTTAHELLVSERPGRPAPQPEEVLHWLRLNMPIAAASIDAILHPAD